MAEGDVRGKCPDPRGDTGRRQLLFTVTFYNRTVDYCHGAASPSWTRFHPQLIRNSTVYSTTFVRTPFLRPYRRITISVTETS